MRRTDRERMKNRIERVKKGKRERDRKRLLKMIKKGKSRNGDLKFT